MIYDTHAHLDFPEFQSELPQIVQRARDAGVSRIITIGTTLAGSQRAVEIAEEFPDVFAAVGWHPSNVESAPEELPPEFERLGAHEKVVALGEMGLDFSRLPGEAEDGAVNERYKERQKRLFQQQLELARRLKLNVIIHQREAFEETLVILKGFTESARAVFHCFVGSPEERERIEKMNCLVSFTGIITFKNADLAREAVKSAPLRGGFMVETDCPYLAPVPHRGKRCEPAHVMETAQRAAELKQVTLEELGVETCRTARSFFRGVE